MCYAIRTGLVAFFALTIPAAAQNVLADTWYFGGGGGWTNLENEAAKIAGGALPIRQSFGGGFDVGGRLGYELGAWRFEEEIRYQQNPASRIALMGTNSPASGNRSGLAFMSNGIYDFSLGPWPFTPHFGAGIGAVQMHDSASIKGVGTFVRNTDWQLGYQAIAGLRYQINPSLALDIDYRYLATTTPSFRGTALLGGLRYSSGYQTHNLVASLSVPFGAPSPVPLPPAPPAAPPIVGPQSMSEQTLLTMAADLAFPPGSYSLTRAGRARLGELVPALQGLQDGKIVVYGYSDSRPLGAALRVNGIVDNLDLSSKRANEVVRFLQSKGVDPSILSAKGRGDTHPIAPNETAQGRAQNRRVELVVEAAVRDSRPWPPPAFPPRPTPLPPEPFPWPPPQPYAKHVIPREIFVKNAIPTFEQVSAKIAAEFRNAGYPGLSFYSVRDGFAIVTRLERVDPLGQPLTTPQRWQDMNNATFALPAFSLRKYLSALLWQREGHFRLFVFIISPHDLVTDPNAQATPEMVHEWQQHGAAALPGNLADQAFSSRHKVYVLLYQFKKLEGQSPEVVSDGTVAEHLHATHLHFE